MAASQPAHPHIPTRHGNLWIWGSINNNNILESPLNQRQESSCVVHSVTRASYYREKIKRFRQGQKSMGISGLVPIFDRFSPSDFATVCTLARTVGYTDSNGSPFYISAHNLAEYDASTWVSQLVDIGPFPVGFPIYLKQNLLNIDGLLVYSLPKKTERDVTDVGHAVTIVGYGQIRNRNVWVYEDSYGVMGESHGSLHQGYGIIDEEVPLIGCFTYV